MAILSRTILLTVLLGAVYAQGNGNDKGKARGKETVEGAADVPLVKVTGKKGEPPRHGSSKKNKAKGGKPKSFVEAGTPKRKAILNMGDFRGQDVSDMSEMGAQFFENELEMTFALKPCKSNGKKKGLACATGSLSSGGSDYGVINVLQKEDGSLVGSATTSDAVFQFTAGADGTGEVIETLVDDFPDELEPPEENPPKPEDRTRALRGDAKEQSSRRLDDGSVIDIMVVYTQDAETAQGGQQGMLDLIDLAVVETNQAYANSNINLELNLVHAYKDATYSEGAGFSAYLSDLRTNGDGKLDGVHSLRTQYGADLVALIVDDNQYCGIGYKPSTASSSNAYLGFSVTSDSCATGYFSFGHEIGHNQGCNHDTGNANSGFEPAYGFRTADNSKRSIMAYSPGTRIQYFSNPDVTINSAPFGSSDESNALNIINTKNAVANYVQSVSGPSPPTPAPTPSPTPSPTSPPPAGPSSTLATTYAANYVYHGCIFDVNAVSNIKVTGMDVHLYTTGTVEVQVYTQSQTYTIDPWWSWTLVGSAQVQGAGYGTPVGLPSNLFGSGLNVNAGSTRSFLVVSPASVMLFSSNPFPGTSEATEVVSDGTMEITNGRYTNYYGSPSLPVNSAGYTYYWNGAITYEVL